MTRLQGEEEILKLTWTVGLRNPTFNGTVTSFGRTNYIYEYGSVQILVDRSTIRFGSYKKASRLL